MYDGLLFTYRVIGWGWYVLIPINVIIGCVIRS
jgi:hypothetical protein